MERLAKLRQSFTKLEQSTGFQRFKTFFNRLIILGIIGIIAYQLIDIGWREVLSALPTQPLFYLIFVFLYLSLPVAEIFIYRMVWTFNAKLGFRAFLLKRVYNEEVMGYSGEFYLLMWAREKLHLTGKEALKNIRDNSILSSLTSNLVAVVLVGGLLYSGHLSLSDLFGEVNTIYILLGIFALILVSAALIQFRKYIFELPPAKAVKVFGIYFFRFNLHHSLLVVQWMIVLPEVPLTVWLIFLATIIVVKRLPFIPNKELIFVSAGIELSRLLDMSTASVAAMLLVSSVLAKIINLILLITISAKDKLPESVPVKELEIED